MIKHSMMIQGIAETQSTFGPESLDLGALNKRAY